MHGGFWTALFDRRQVVGLADDLGYAVWNIEFRRIGESGGGWPGTFLDVAAAVDAVAGIDLSVGAGKVVVVGHSAGGQLATWAAHRSVLPPAAPGANPRVEPIGAVSLAGVLDLVAADTAKLGSSLADPDAEPSADAPEPSDPAVRPAVAAEVTDGVARVLLGGTAVDVSDHYSQASPTRLPPADVPVLVIHGADDEVAAPSYSRAYADAQSARGADVRFVEVPETTHFDVIDPASPS